MIKDGESFWQELIRYRALTSAFVMRDLRLRYKQTVLGVAWLVIQPLISVVIFSVVFGRVLKIPSNDVPYPVFVLAGILPWTFFATAFMNSAHSVTGAAAMISKVYFPRLIVPLSAVFVVVVQAGVNLALLLVFMIGHDVPIQLTTPLALLPLFCAALLAFGLGALCSALMVRFRDFRNGIPYVVQLWFYATPVVYPLSMVPGGLQWLYQFNPMVAVVEWFRAAMFGLPVDAGLMGIAVLSSVAVAVFGVVVFQRLQTGFADVI